MPFQSSAFQFTLTLTLICVWKPAAGFVVTRRHMHKGLAFVPQSSTGTLTTQQQLHAKPKKQPIQDDDVDANSTSGNTLTSMPANLKRKVHAKRPALGHVVPRHLKNPKAKSVDNPNGNNNNNVVGGSSNPYLRPQGKARDAGLNNPSLLKILGGSAKGRRLDSPQVYLRPMMGKVKEAVFSTFFSLGLYNNYSGTSNTGTSSAKIRHLDIFSGSGSVGLESLSRGATHCTFVDFSDDCCAAASRNMEWCFGGQTATSSSSNGADSNEIMTATPPKTSQIVCADYLQALRDPASVGIDPLVPFQIVTLCPPYEEVVYADLLEAVANSPLVTDDTVVLVEYPVELQTLPHVIRRRHNSNDPESDQVGGALIGIRNRKYGRTVIAIYVCNPTGKLQGAESRPEEFV